MHSSRMCTGRMLTVFRGRTPPRKLGGTPPPKKRHPPKKFGGTPQKRHPKKTPPQKRHPPVNRITHTCKNITLAKTSFRPVTTNKTKRNPTRVDDTEPKDSNTTTTQGSASQWNRSPETHKTLLNKGEESHGKH